MAKENMGRSSIIFAAMTLVSRVLGLIRDILIARYFDTALSDPFFAALRIPNTLRRFFAEGGFANAFVPVFSSTKKKSPNELKQLLRYTSGTLLFILIGITLFGVIFSSAVIYAVANGLVAKPTQFTLAANMLQIMFPYALLISLAAMANGVLNTYGKFAVTAFTPVLLNITLIAASLWRYFHQYDTSGIELAWAVLIGGILQLAIQLPFLWKLGLLVRPRWGWRAAGVQRIIRLMVPTLFGSSIGQLTILVNTFLASMLVTGSISWLYYSDRMVELPIALVGVALGTIILPRLSALEGIDNKKKFIATLDWALRWGLLGGSAASTGLAVLSPPILSTLFYGGTFSEQDVFMTTLSLRVYAVSGVFLILVKILAPAFYAQHDTVTPAKSGVIAMIINIFFAVVLSRLYAHVGLAAASSIAAVVNVILLIYFLMQRGYTIERTLWFLGVQVLVANTAMALVLLYLQVDITMWLQWTRWQRILHLGLLISIGVIVYGITLYLLGVRRGHLVRCV